MIDFLHNVSKQNEAGTLVTANRPLHHERRTLAHRVPNPCHLRSACQETEYSFWRFRTPVGIGKERDPSLVDGIQRFRMLELQIPQRQTRVRFGGRKREKNISASPVVFSFRRRNTNRDACLPQVRQSPMLQSRSSFSW